MTIATYQNGFVLATEDINPNNPGSWNTSFHKLSGTTGGVNRIGQVRLFSNMAAQSLPAMEAWLLTNPPAQDYRQKDNTPFAIMDRNLYDLATIVQLNRAFVGKAGGNCVLQSEAVETAIPAAASLWAILVFRGKYAAQPGEEFTLQVVAV
jgi:hypothetical protein